MPKFKNITSNIKNISGIIADTAKKLKRRYNRSDSSTSVPEASIPSEIIIETVIRIPAVRINRNAFLTEQFKGFREERKKTVLETGPVEAGCGRGELKNKAVLIVQKRMAQSLIRDVPEDILRNTAIAYDTLVFYSAAIQLIQEIAYLYGESDFWIHTDTDPDKTVGRLHLYYSVMTGSGKAEKALKLLSSSVTSKSFNKLTESFLEKTVYQPIVKPTAKALGVKMPKMKFNRIVSKAMPIVKNAVADGINLTSLLPMANRLIKTLDEAQFAYSAADFEADWYEIEKENEASPEAGETEKT